MRDYISSLVQQTLNEYLKKEHRKPHILILLTNNRADYKDIWKHIKELSNLFSISLLVSEKEQKNVIDSKVNDVTFLEKVNEEDIHRFTQTIDLLYCPSISHGFLAKLSLLLDDACPVWVTLQMLLGGGKEVLLGNDVIEQRRSVNFWRRPSIDRKVQSYINDLKNDGINFCSMKQASKIIAKRIKKAHDKRPLLLAKHIEEVAKIGHKEIIVPKNSIITPMAKDAATELRVAIKEENDDERRDDL